jgi:hypothetical protein
MPPRSRKTTDDSPEQDADSTEAPEATEVASAPRPDATERIGTTVMERAYMDALQRERAGYEQRGLTDRVAQVDAELKRFKR